MDHFIHNIKNWINTNKLLAIEYVIPKHGKEKFLGRLLQYTPEEEMFIFYVDDSKSVLKLTAKQIEKIEPK